MGLFKASMPADTVVSDLGAKLAPSDASFMEKSCHRPPDDTVTKSVQGNIGLNNETTLHATGSSSSEGFSYYQGIPLKYAQSSMDKVMYKNPLDDHADNNPIDSISKRIGGQTLAGISKIATNRPAYSKIICDNMDQETVRNVSEDCLMMSSTPFDVQLSTNGHQESTLAGYEIFVTNDDSAVREGHQGKCTVISPDQIICCMRNNIGKPHVLREQVRALQNLTISDESRDRIGALGGVVVSVDVIKANPKDEPLRKEILIFLSDLCRSSQRNQIKLGQCYGLQLLVHIVQDSRSTPPDLIERACVALRVSCTSCPLNQTIAGKSGAIQAVLTVLRQRQGGISLQEECLRALFHFTHDHSPNISVLEENGGPEEITAACGAYSFDAGFQATTFNLTHSLVRQSPRLRMSLSRAGLLEEISSTLPLMHSSEPFIKGCAGTLRFLGFHGAIRKAICLTTIIETLITSLSHHRNETSVLHPLLIALGNLSFDPPVSKKRACSRDALSTFHSILVHHSTHTVIVTHCLRLLRNISDGSMSVRRTCLQHDTPKFITQAMESLPGAVTVQEHGAAALINLSRIDTELIRSKTLEDHIERVITLHADSTAAHKQLVFLRGALGCEAKGLAKLFRGGASVSRLSSTATASEVDLVLQDTTLANAVAALEEDSDVVEY